MPISSGAREQLVAQAGQLAEIKIPPGLSGDQAAVVSQSIRNSFISGFRVVTIIAAVLAVLSSIVAWVLIPGKIRNHK
jgi:hypothetical protein